MSYNINIQKLHSHLYTFKARVAFSTANTITPTSANTANPIDATPKVANNSIAIFIPIANIAF